MGDMSIDRPNTTQVNTNNVNSLNKTSDSSKTMISTQMNPRIRNVLRLVDQVGTQIKNSENPEDFLAQLPILKERLGAARRHMDLFLEALIDKYCPEEHKETARAIGGDGDKVFAFINQKLHAKKEKEPVQTREVTADMARLKSDFLAFKDLQCKVDIKVTNVITVVRDKSEQMIQDPNVSDEQKAEIKDAFQDLMESVQDMYKHFNMDTSKIDKLCAPLSTTKVQDSNSADQVIKSAEEKTREANQVKKELNEMRAKLREIVSEAIKCRTFIDEAKRAANEKIQDKKDSAKQMMMEDIKKKEERLIDAKKTLQTLSKKRDCIKLAMKEKTQNMLNISFELNKIMDKVASSDFISQFSEQLPDVIDQVDKMCFTKQGEVDNVYDYA